MLGLGLSYIRTFTILATAFSLDRILYIMETCDSLLLFLALLDCRALCRIAVDISNIDVEIPISLTSRSSIRLSTYLQDERERNLHPLTCICHLALQHCSTHTPLYPSLLPHHNSYSLLFTQYSTCMSSYAPKPSSKIPYEIPYAITLIQYSTNTNSPNILASQAIRNSYSYPYLLTPTLSITLHLPLHLLSPHLHPYTHHDSTFPIPAAPLLSPYPSQSTLPIIPHLYLPLKPHTSTLIIPHTLTLPSPTQLYPPLFPSPPPTPLVHTLPTPKGIICHTSNSERRKMANQVRQYN